MPLTLYPFIINRKSGFVKAFLRSRLSSAQQTIFIAATTCRQLPALLTSVSNSIAGSVLPPSVCEGALPYVRGCFTSERLAFSTFRGDFPNLVTATHL